VTPAAVTLFLFLLVTAACGSRTGLFDFPTPTLTPDDAGPFEDSVAPIDATVPDDAGKTCGDSSTASVAYLVDQGGGFWSFDPPSLTAVRLTTLACPGVDTTPFTMTVTEGTGYVMYQDNSLYALDLATFACAQTPFTPSQISLQGPLGLASAYEAGNEWLYVYGCIETAGGCPPALARADLSTFALSLVGTVSPLPADPQGDFPADMKADAFGRLFAIDFVGTLLEIDPTNAHVDGFDETGFDVSGAEALLTWNGSIYIFGGDNGMIETYDLATQTLTTVGAVGAPIVGAGSAPCVH
jgi:hypothetical protein